MSQNPYPPAGFQQPPQAPQPTYAPPSMPPTSQYGQGEANGGGGRQLSEATIALTARLWMDRLEGAARSLARSALRRRLALYGARVDFSTRIRTSSRFATRKARSAERHVQADS